MKEKRFAGSGRFVWHELVTGDVDVAVDFYGRLFGWDFREGSRPSRERDRIFSVGNVDLGRIIPLHEADTVPPSWLPFVTVEDVDRSIADALNLGGGVVSSPSSIAGFGEYALLHDPSGAQVAVFTGGDPDEDLDEGPPRPGTFIWNDVISRNPEESAKFYCGLFGWQLFKMDLGSQGTYLLMKRGEVNEGGIIRKPEEAEGPSTWLPYVAVEDLANSCAKAARDGGSILVPPSDLHGAGTYAVIADPAGAILALFEAASG
jgi:hypothetical protein